MKNKFILLLIIFLAVFLFSCNKPDDKEMTDEEILEVVKQDLNIKDTYDSDIDLKTSYIYNNKTIEASWSSSKPKVLTNEGKYIPSNKNENIALNLTLSLGGATLTDTFFITFNAATAEEIIDAAWEYLNINNTITNNIQVGESFEFGTNIIRFSMVSNDENVIKNDGSIVLKDTDASTAVTFTLSAYGQSKSYPLNVTVKAVDKNELSLELSKLLEELSYSTDISLPKKITFKGCELDLIWESENEKVLKNNGEIVPQSSEQHVNLKVKSSFQAEYIYDIIVLPLADRECINRAFEEIYIPKIINSDIKLNSTLSYGVKATWTISDPSAISNQGKVLTNTVKTVTINLKLEKGEETMTTDYNVQVAKAEHMFIDRTFDGIKENTEIKGGKLVLTSDAISGTYSTGEISVTDFNECVGSFSCITSKKATCELEVRIKVNNTWSVYYSYGAWGRGLKNACYGKSDSISKMVEDEIKTTKNPATAFELKVTLRRDALNVDSPVLSLVALSLDLANYSYPVDITNVKKEVKYDVPCLYQQIVPEIGGSICSPTSCTMLMKFKGYSFLNLEGDAYELSPDIPKSQTSYEHGYFANIAKDYGNNIFGNWSYCCIAMGSYGENAYVKRFFSENELIHQLAYCGPIAASIKGYVINGVKNYNTAGHLMVVSGYRIEGNNIYYYIHDPNVPSVAVEMTSENFFNIWRNVGYVLEY